MRNLLSIIILGSIITACTGTNGSVQEKGITISGTVTNAPTGLIVLEQPSKTALTPIDTVVVNDDNTYSLSFTGEAGYYRLNFFNQRAATLILDQDDIIINFDGSAATGLQPEGSREIAAIENFYQQLNNEFGPKEQAINAEFQQAAQAGDQTKQEEIRGQYMELVAEKQAFSAEIIKGMEVNLASYQLLSNVDTDMNIDLKDSIASILNTRYPGRYYIEDLVANIAKAKTTAIGKQAPEISLPNPDGQVVKLSSLQGQVVLVDFWAQWCKPCRQENPNVVAAYKKYKDKGFTVYGVSLDRTKDKWLQAIEEDGLTWTHVSDLKYFNSVAAETYGISSIPFSILLDREGKIIAKNLRGAVLDKTLEEYFSEEGKM